MDMNAPPKWWAVLGKEYLPDLEKESPKRSPKSMIFPTNRVIVDDLPRQLLTNASDCYIFSRTLAGASLSYGQ